MLLIILTFVLAFLALWIFGPLVLSSFGISLSNELNLWTNMLKSLVETMAIIIAGIWAYDRFIKSREKYPYPRIEYKIQHYRLDKEIIYLNVFVIVTNKGKRKLNLGEGIIYVRQVLPLSNRVQKMIAKSSDENIRKGNVPKLFIEDKQRIGWDKLGERKWSEVRTSMQELEPGQTRDLQFAFLIEGDIKTVEVVSSVDYEKSLWELAEIYSLKKNNEFSLDYKEDN